MAAGVLVGRKFTHQAATGMVITEQNKHQSQLGVHPATRHQRRVFHQHPDTEHQRRDHRGRADTAIELALHDLEAIDARLIRTHGVIDKQTRQIEQRSKPADNGNDVKRFEPEHGGFPWSGIRG